ncbi:uncharacterized protein BP01DRAFT_423059 [Aspergillus saccharolyticus JOP 1030-1]|uniref:Uncharacterized protein n=1 Tax=Aspergillus saccharolyticus JOP 1030-1 TaxID=1450539 RepID=A0A318ZH31_9EURO|nr:hypothetical protein BP01DRAFT_423059 [Aspergillus saccharolyticus JOP 1030-1]PYH46067.1 hypothetical protein BP01DRAFT_423059 [Aspergillus saccharolyticus JOP 1030-1]
MQGFLYAAAYIWVAYSSLEDAYDATITSAPPGDTNSPIPSDSCPSPARSYPEENPCSAYHFLPGTATLFCWPVTTADGDLCLQNGTTVSASRPTTAIVNGETFISPTVYLSFTSIYAWSNCRAHPGSQCGGSHSNEILSIHPSTLSSVRYHRNAKYPDRRHRLPLQFRRVHAARTRRARREMPPSPSSPGRSTGAGSSVRSTTRAVRPSATTTSPGCCCSRRSDDREVITVTGYPGAGCWGEGVEGCGCSWRSSGGGHAGAD